VSWLYRMGNAAARTSQGSHIARRASLKYSLAYCSGVLLCFYSTMVCVQYRAWEVYDTGIRVRAPSKVERGRNFVLQKTSSRRLDSFLAKYNLTTLRHHTKIKIPDANRSIVFLHIGKTGGSTISMHIRNGCREKYMTPCKNRKDGWTPNETVASRRIEAYYHMEDIAPDRLERFTTIITAVRNPITRFLSAFAYGHPTNSMATDIGHVNNMELLQKYSCFPSISYLVKAGMGHAVIPWNKAHLHKLRQNIMINPARRNTHHLSRKSTHDEIPPINCTKLARIAFGLDKSWKIVNSSHPWPGSHMSFDYRQYYRSMHPDKELIVLRKNRLQEDWVKVNDLLSAENDAYAGWPGVPPFQENERNISNK